MYIYIFENNKSIPCCANTVNNGPVIVLAAVVQTLDSAIHRIKIYPMDSTVGFPNTYPLDSDLSGG